MKKYKVSGIIEIYINTEVVAEDKKETIEIIESQYMTDDCENLDIREIK